MKNFTNEQIERIFKLCGEITAVRNELPKPPQGYNVNLEAAIALRASLEQHTPALTELATILALPTTKD